MKAVDFIATCPDGTVVATHRRINPRNGPIQFVIVGKRIREGDNAAFQALEWLQPVTDAQYTLNKIRKQKFYDAVIDPTARGDRKKNYIGYRLENPRQVYRDVHLLPAEKPPAGMVVLNGKLITTSTQGAGCDG